MKLLQGLLLSLCLLVVPAVTLVGIPSSVEAQQPPATPDYETWNRTAARATEAIEASRASSAAMEYLREQLVDWRGVFLAAQGANSNAIATIEEQLQAFGPVPEDGAEAEDIAAQRGVLTEQLAVLRAPVKTAQLAYSQADSLIKGVDRIIRDRQTEALLELGPSPLNPILWPDGINAVFQLFSTVSGEVKTAWASEIQRKETQENLPVIILLTVVGFVFLGRGRYWVQLLVRLVIPRRATAASWIIALMMSLGEVLVPFIGLIALIEALYASGLVGLRSDLLLSALKPAVLIFLIARWLALRCFPRHTIHRVPLLLNPQDRRAGRYYGGALGVVISLFYFVSEAAEISNWSTEANNVVLFPVIVVSGLLLFWLSRLLTKHDRAASDDESNDSYRNRVTRILSKALIVLAVVAPSLAAIGYFQAAERLLLPSLLSLLLFAGLLVVQRVLTEIYVLINGDRDGAADELIPVLLGFAMFLLSAPVFALLWGARVADLSELWVQFKKGITLGELQISPTIFLTLAIVFTVGFILTRLLQGTLKNAVLPKTKMDPGGRNAVVSGIGYIGIFLSAIIAITSAGIDLSSIAIVAGALSVGIGFGLQNIVSNFVSGIILLIERPISQGDWIEVNGTHGYVKDISVRSTRVETFDRSDVIIPNADLVSGTVTNYTRGNTVGRVIVPVGVAYGTDTRKVEKILGEIASAHPMVLLNPEPTIVMKAFGADSLDFEIRAILRDVNWMLSVHSDMNHEIARRFAEEGIEIPFAQRDVWLRNPEVLQPVPPKRDKSETAKLTSARKRNPLSGEPQRVEDADGSPDGGDI